MILITGATGFIGSNIFAAIAKKKYFDEIVLCDWFGQGDKWKNVAHHSFSNFVFPEDLDDFLSENKAALKMIIHMGAISDTTEIDADYIMATNYQLPMKLWDFASDNEVRFIYASSAATYGDGSMGFSDQSIEDLKPLNPYAFSKHSFDLYAKHQAHFGIRTPIQWVGLKFFNVYGPNEYHKGSQRSVVHQFFNQIEETGKVKLFKPHAELGAPMRDFVYVKDCVKVIEWFIEHPEENGIFNLGTGKARSFEDLAHVCFAAMGKESKIEYIEMPQHLIGKYQYHTEASMSKLKKAGCAHKFTSLEDGVKEYIQGYLLTDCPYV